METMVGKTKLSLVQGDITQQDMEAIVNAANTSLLGGSGVDGASHRVGGPRILEECKAVRAKQGGCPTGQAVITTGGRLKAHYVIHTVGPVWSGGKKGEEELLKSAYDSSLTLAKERGIRSIAFPSISTGAYRFPIERAARIALSTVKDFLTRKSAASESHSFSEVRFVLFSEKDLKVYENCWKELSSTQGD